jgi:hypothetical protein
MRYQIQRRMTAKSHLMFLASNRKYELKLDDWFWQTRWRGKCKKQGVKVKKKRELALRN